MTIQALLIDFDGTITSEDVTDVLCGIVGKQAESYELNQLFQEGKLPGLQGLVRRINFFQGLSLAQIREAATARDYLKPGARELFRFARSQGITTIISSGSIVPLLQIYQEDLGADYVVGSKPIIRDDRIVSISEHEYSGLDFKVRDAKDILDRLGIAPASVVAIGDSPADTGMFAFAAKSIAIDPRAGVEKYADYVIRDDLSQAIPILRKLLGVSSDGALY